MRDLGIGPAPLGVILGAFGPGFLLGSLVAGRAARRYGVGRAMAGATLLNAFAAALIPLARGSEAATISTLVAAHFLLALGIQVHGVNLVSLRQAMTPHHQQGRMNASFRVVNVCAMMAGALIAGPVGEVLGLRATLIIGACGMLLPFIRLIWSPVRNLEGHPS